MSAPSVHHFPGPWQAVEFEDANGFPVAYVYFDAYAQHTLAQSHVAQRGAEHGGSDCSLA